MRRKRTAPGSRCVEIMIALSLLAIGLLSLAAMQITAMKYGARGRHQTKAGRDRRGAHGDADARSAGANLTPTAAGPPAVTNESIQGPHTRSSRPTASRGRSPTSIAGRTRSIDVRVQWTEPNGPAASSRCRVCASTMKVCNAVRKVGFTLIEMLTVVAIFGLVAIYVGRILVVNERAYHTVENTSESQQNLRVFGELVEDDLRHAGMMVPARRGGVRRDNTTAPDVLYVSDAGAIDRAGRLRLYRRTRDPGGPYNLNTNGTAQTFTLSSLIVEPARSRPAYDTERRRHADSDFRVNGGVIVFDPARPRAATRAVASRPEHRHQADHRASASPRWRAPRPRSWRCPPTSTSCRARSCAGTTSRSPTGSRTSRSATSSTSTATTRRRATRRARGLGAGGRHRYASSELRPNQMRELADRRSCRARA
jgi:prepilin-type N-terminal cleavage/methylation domain-containing protein